MSCKRCLTWFAALALLIAALFDPANGQTPDFADFSLEQLAHYEVTTLGRKDATVFNTPAPADVVSGDEIHRSGAMTLAEALRLAPGVQVSRIDSVNYSISVRGFNDATSSKLLVLMDGRSVYNQLSSGTNWALLDLVLDDVSRIEVQRGSAGTLWGANAVNGVINIVSKNAHSTLGSLVSVAFGNELEYAFSAREGFALSPSTAVRVYTKFQKHGDYGGSKETGGTDDWNIRLVGTRLDWDRPGGGGLAVIGEFRELRIESDTLLPTLIPPYSSILPEQRRDRSADLSLHWNQPVTLEGQLSILAALSRGDSEQFTGDERHTTADIDAQLTLHPLPRHEVIVGATYRSTSDRIRNTPYLDYSDPEARTDFFGAFLQDEISLIPDVFNVTVGSKSERNTFTGWETQPSLRALWHPTRSQSVWAAASLSARTPSRAERGVRLFAATLPPSESSPLPMAIVANGAADFNSEHVASYELGHRYETGPNFSFATSLFYSRYFDLRGLHPTIVPPDFSRYPVYLEEEFVATNSLRGYTSGGELSARWRPRTTLEVEGSVASLRTHLHEVNPGAFPDPTAAGIAGNSPAEEYKLHLTWRPTSRWTVDVMVRHTTSLDESNVPAYNGLDLRLALAPRPYLELELIGRDLLTRSHAEISDTFLGTEARAIDRSIYARITFHR